MNANLVTKRIIQMKDQGLTWDQVYPLIRSEFKDLPSNGTIRRWYYTMSSGNQIRVNHTGSGGYSIPPRNKELIKEIFTDQLQSMKLSSKEIQKELKRLID